METGVFGMEGKLNTGDAHLAVNYERILAQGVMKLIQREMKEKLLIWLALLPDSVDKYMFYNSVLTVIEAVHTFTLRYSSLAKEMAEKKQILQEKKNY